MHRYSLGSVLAEALNAHWGWSRHWGAREPKVADCPQIFAEVRKAGGEPINLVNLSFGERTKLPHGKAAPHAFKNNEPATIEVRGTKRAYAAGIARTHSPCEQSRLSPRKRYWIASLRSRCTARTRAHRFAMP